MTGKLHPGELSSAQVKALARLAATSGKAEVRPVIFHSLLRRGLFDLYPVFAITEAGYAILEKAKA